LSYDNVKLWFAKTDNEKIITIDEINDSNKNNTYTCPMCGSELIPKAIKSKQITSHFAHVDASRCNSETMIHWWFKHKFIEVGDTFTVVSDKERQYICKEVLTEQTYLVDDKVYRPDITILTECGKTIYFEMAFSNKKKIQDYIDFWLELKNIVVEVDIKKLMSRDTVPAFKALFYEGKCFNMKKNDLYYNTIGKYKVRLNSNLNDSLRERIKKLDWFWNDIFKYKKGEIDINHLVNLIDSIDDEDKHIVFNILNKPTCIDIYKDYTQYKVDEKYKIIKEFIINQFGQDYVDIIGKNIRYVKELKRYKGSLLVLNRWGDYSEWDVEYNDHYYLEKWIEGSVERIKKIKESEVSY
jgi:predicted RNA-binding Zn-ribbon protein involved in translation (DUF1610 family)